MKDFFAASITFDLRTAANFIPEGQSLIREEHTWRNCPAFNLRQLDGGALFSEGCTGRGMEFRRVPSGFDRETSNTLHDALLMVDGAPDKWHVEQAESLFAELAAKGVTIPEICFRAYGFGYPTSRGFACILNGNLIVL